MSSVYVTWVYRTFYSQYSIKLPKELIKKCKKLYDNCSELRQNRPHVFCGFVTSILFLMAVIGHLVSGTSIMCGNVATSLAFRQPCSHQFPFSQLASSLLSSLLPNTTSKSSKKTVSLEIVTRLPCSTFFLYMKIRMWCVARDVMNRLITTGLYFSFTLTPSNEKQVYSKVVSFAWNLFVFQVLPACAFPFTM